MTKENSAKTNWLALVILFLLVIGIGIGSYWWQKKYEVTLPTETSLVKPTPNPTETQVPSQTSDWKTYTSEKYDFSIKYHPDWAFKEYETDKLSVAFAVSENALPRPQTDQPACISIVVRPLLTDEERTSDLSKIEKETIKIGDITAQKITLLAGREDDLLFGNDQIASVEIEIANNEVIVIKNFDDCFLDVFLKMVDSFQFLNE